VSRRHSGLNIPLSAVRSKRSWGVGELADLKVLAAWLSLAGMDRLLLLPLGTIEDGQTSPYSAISSLSIDPIYLSLDDVIDFSAAGGADALSRDTREALSLARESPRVQFGLVRQAKREALGLAFAHFYRSEWQPGSSRAGELVEYCAREREWLDDYALFSAVSEKYPGSWQQWPVPLRDRDPTALAAARRSLEQSCLAHQYGQWIAETQWQAVKADLKHRGVTLFGDLPFVTNLQSPEVWSRADEFQAGVSLGVPPDAFSATGQDWGLPTYDWDAIAARGYAAIRQRARRMARLYDGLRVDHVVGLYRTYGRPVSGDPFFTPSEEPAQIAQGEAVLRILTAADLELIAEDLGVVPDFVRASLARLDIPGCKVLRWERDWKRTGHPFQDPAMYPAVSATMTGTHDTSTLAGWWTETSLQERQLFLDLPTVQGSAMADSPWTNALRDATLTLVHRSTSRDLFLPIQDIFGWIDRINVPGTVTDDNWTWALPWPVEDLLERRDTQERAAFLRRLGLARHRTENE
jgi:4-alpha-glucanotransferase